MCEKCVKRHKEDMEAANEHMDARGVPEDSLLRGIADIHLACNAHPPLQWVMKHCWPDLSSLMQ